MESDSKQDRFSTDPTVQKLIAQIKAAKTSRKFEDEALFYDHRLEEYLKTAATGSTSAATTDTLSQNGQLAARD